MSESDAKKWNTRYASDAAPDTEPVPFLVDNIHRLGSGKALVLAAGQGRNAVYLAAHGFDVTALDVSQVGLSRCLDLARSRGVTLTTVCADLDTHDLGESAYDLVTMIYFYEPDLFPAVRLALRPGGHFLFQTFSTKHAEVGTFGPRNPAYLASADVLLDAFGSDQVILCEEAILSEDDDTEAVLRAIIQVT